MPFDLRRNQCAHRHYIRAAALDGAHGAPPTLKLYGRPPFGAPQQRFERRAPNWSRAWCAWPVFWQQAVCGTRAVVSARMSCVYDLRRKWRPRLRVARRWERNGCAPYRRSARTNDPYRRDRHHMYNDGVARVEQQNSFHAASACYNLAAPIRPRL